MNVLAQKGTGIVLRDFLDLHAPAALAIKYDLATGAIDEQAERVALDVEAFFISRRLRSDRWGRFAE